MTRADGLVVMPAGQRERGRLLRGIDHGQIVMGHRVVGLELDGPAQGGFGRPAQAFLAQHDAEIVLRVGVIRIGLGRTAQSVERSTVWPDTVKRGDIPRNVRGMGTLVPEDIVSIPATNSARRI